MAQPQQKASQPEGLPIAEFTVLEDTENSGTMEGKLNINEIVGVNGNTDLSSVIYYEGGGFVQSIQYVSNAGLDPNQLQVLGQAPSDAGHMDFSFLDNSDPPGEYRLSILSTDLEVHTLDILGDAVTIVNIGWWRG